MLSSNPASATHIYIVFPLTQAAPPVHDLKVGAPLIEAKLAKLPITICLPLMPEVLVIKVGVKVTPVFVLRVFTKLVIPARLTL